MAPLTNFLNNLSDEPVVIRINDHAAPYDNGQVETGWHSGLTTGKFGAKNASANVVEASASDQLPALGVLTFNARNAWQSATNKSGNKDYNFVDLYHDSIVIKIDGYTLTPGQPIWLSSGGGITQNHPAVIGQLRQQLGFAISSSEYAVHVCDAETMGI